MCYRVRVILQCDPYGVHTRPAAWVAQNLRGLEASIQFCRDGASVDIRPDLAILDVMQAATDLGLACGCSFEITCQGPQAREAYLALREGFTTNYFEGGQFLLLESPGEADDA